MHLAFVNASVLWEQLTVPLPALLTADSVLTSSWDMFAKVLSSSALPSPVTYCDRTVLLGSDGRAR